MKKLIIICSIICFAFANSFAQTGIYSSQNRKAIANYEEGLRNYQYSYYDKALQNLSDAIKIDPSFAEAYYLLAGVYAKKKDDDKMIESLQLAVQNCSANNPMPYYKLAVELLNIGRYSEALQNFKKIQSKDRPFFSPKEQEHIALSIRQATDAIQIMKSPIPFSPVNMGKNINTQFDDYHPAITVDDNLFIFTSNIPINARMTQEDIFYSTRQNGEWQPRRVFPAPITTPNNEGAASISADGRTMVYTMCNAPGGYGSCDIYITYYALGQWTMPKNIGAPINTKHWESQPSLSADGKTLYFVSNRPGGKGKKDIWVSRNISENQWSEPENLGEPINTANDEESPFIHADGKTLFFSSDGHLGLGKKDIFITQRYADGTWKTPVNAGYPLNSKDDEGLVIVNAQGTKGYFASNREGGFGGLDLYEFSISPNMFAIMPFPVTYVKGLVFNAKEPVKRIAAQLDLRDVETNELLFASNADYNGNFTVPFMEGRNYALSVSFPGYLFYSAQVNLETNRTMIEVPLQPIEVGSSVVLNNVFFDTDSYELKPESQAELLTIVDFMKVNLTLSFEIGGHTDNTGTKQNNITLSNNRAQAVYSFLVEHGIDSKRLTYKGYADTKPLAPNDSEANKAKNRRTELKITKK
ncbi:MAG: OmpA family protein [Bacteroidetes bacterium]|nr:OmpA family protein [Bacteroidota bacterium]